MLLEVLLQLGVLGCKQQKGTQAKGSEKELSGFILGAGYWVKAGDSGWDGGRNQCQRARMLGPLE